MALRPRTSPRAYDVGRRVAVGGMGEIYEGRSPDLERRVAIKRVLKSDDVPELKGLFIREVAVAAMLEHPNVVEVLDAGAVGQDLYLVMEFVDGPSLAEVLLALRRRRQLLPIELTCGLMAPIARGLAHAHGRALPDGTSLGIIHRDVAPENVLITRGGVAKVADFGLARLAGHEFTSPGTIRGRPRCLSPEQARGDPIDVRADVFALGAMLFEMVSGEGLYPEEALASLLFKVAAGDYIPVRRRLPRADGDLLAILETALAVDAGRRFRSARELERALDAYRAARGLRVDSDAIARLVADLGVEILRIRAEKREEVPGELEGRRLTLPEDVGEAATLDVDREPSADLMMPRRRSVSGQITGDLEHVSAPPAYFDADTTAGARVPRAVILVGDDTSGPFTPEQGLPMLAPEPATESTDVIDPRATEWSAPPLKRADIAAALEDEVPTETIMVDLPPRAAAPAEAVAAPTAEAPVAPETPPRRGRTEVGWALFLGLLVAAAALAFAQVWADTLGAEPSPSAHGDPPSPTGLH